MASGGRWFLGFGLLTGILTATAGAQGPAAPVRLAAQVISSDFQQPVFLVSPPGDPRLFVVDQPGRIWIVQNGERLDTPFLDIRNLVSFGGEQGLLGLAFHPGYVSNGRFFINYTDNAGDTQVVAYRVSSDPNRADPDSASILLSIDQPAANHNGGWLGFGPDGLLYIATGDGGGGGDTFNTGQNPNSLLAKLLRIDVDRGSPYAIPSTNPFARGGGAPEAWAWGLRNPWRVAFDGEDVYIADVGQNAWEEVSVIPLAGAGANLGWSIMEGAHCFRAASCDQAGLVLPVYEFRNGEDGACSVTGGYVYRGSAIPELAGHYFFSDYCAGFVRSFRYSGGQAADLIDWSSQLGDLGNITSFGVDSAGELYIVAADGRVMKLVRG